MYAEGADWYPVSVYTIVYSRSRVENQLIRNTQIETEI